MKERYEKSKLKTRMSFVEWYTKNNWEYRSETKYTKESHAISVVEHFKEENFQTKLFSVKVDNEDTVNTINKIREENSEIEYILRNDAYTEIIYKDTYKEI